MKEEDLPLDDSGLNDAHRVAYLIAGHIRGTLTPAERRELDEWVAADERNVQLFEQLTDERNIHKALAWYEQTNTEKALKRVKRRISFPGRRTPFSFWSWGVAAAVLIILIVGVAIWVEKKTPTNSQQVAQTNKEVQDRAPGGSVAVLTLSDGRELLLDKTADGNIAVQGNTEIIKKDSALAYNTHPQLGIKQEPVINTLSTPKGGMYSLILSDGTKVWLNAASSLRFPTAFTGSERNVELSGEGYFEVAKDPTRPFQVQAGNTKIQVLGTHFNVNAYADEGIIKTTLLEGSVKVISNGKEHTIKPGEEAQAGSAGIQVVPADEERATGWRQGNFVFHATPMKEVLGEIERWYNVEVINTAGNNSHLNATFPRTVPLSKLIAYLQGTGAVQFKWAAGKLLVEK